MDRNKEVKHYKCDWCDGIFIREEMIFFSPELKVILKYCNECYKNSEFGE